MKTRNTAVFIAVLSVLTGCSGIQKVSQENLPAHPTGSANSVAEERKEACAPVAFPLPTENWIISGLNVVLQSKKDGALFPAQITSIDQDLISHKAYASAMVPLSRIGHESFQCQTSKETIAQSSELHWKDDHVTTLSLYEGDREILQYHYGVILPPAGVAAHRARSSYFHPLKGLDGETFTQDFPDDHYHHRGFYFAWPGVFVDGQRYDMWHLIGMWTKFERILVQEEGPVFALLVIENGWYHQNGKVMDEIMELRVWHSDSVGQALDVNYTWTPGVPIQIGPKDYKGYGGVNFRFPARENTVVTTVEGVQAKDSDLKRSPWADLSGRFERRPTMSGVAFFNHPTNIDPNPGWTIRPSDTYGYIGVSWPGRDAFDFVPGQKYRNRYRLWIHRGNCEVGAVLDAYNFYRSPQAIAIEK